MSNLSRRLSIFLLPAVVFGYALYSNAAIFASVGLNDSALQVGSVPPLNWLNGKATAELDAFYKRAVPHRDSAVGFGGNARYILFGTGRRGVVVGKENWLFTNEEFRKVSTADIDGAVAKIADVKKLLGEKGVALLVVPLPGKADIYSEYLPANLLSNDIHDTYTQFTASLAGAGVASVDARKSLLAHKADGVFLKTDTHWSPVGAKLVAQAVAVAVTTLNLQLQPAKITAVEDAPTVVWGDLTKFITLPEYAEEIELKPETVAVLHTQVEAADTEVDLFGEDDAAPVMLVGTSYSANANWSFESELRRSLSVDVVNVAKEGLGPGIPMLELLSGDILKKSVPKVVIWEFPVRYIGTATLWQRSQQGGHGGHTATVGGTNGV
jgi:alginate O-acetyltransferase complex protein AlgJ